MSLDTATLARVRREFESSDPDAAAIALERYSGPERVRVHAAILYWVESAEPAAQTRVPLPHLVERTAIELVKRHDLDEIESLLITEGAARALAPRLVLLVPSAFAREVFEPQGIAFPETFLTPGEGDADPIEHSYLEEPVYLEARTLARGWISASKEGAIARILEWSAEAGSIEEARTSGLTPSRVGPVTHDFRVAQPGVLFAPHLKADIDPATIEPALAVWRWLIGDRWSPILTSAVGDIFLTDPSGVIARLDTGAGKLKPIASSLEEFRDLLADPTCVDGYGSLRASTSAYSYTQIA